MQSSGVDKGRRESLVPVPRQNERRCDFMVEESGKWRLFSYAVDISISDKLMPSNIEEPPQAALVQCISSLHISFVDCPTLRPVTVIVIEALVLRPILED